MAARVASEAGQICYAQNRPPEPENPPLILIHGAGGNHLHWPPQLVRLQGVSVLALDLPGHGCSTGPGQESIIGYAQAVIELLEALGIKKAVIGGHSMGGAIAQTLALESPERVAGLVLVGTGAKLRVAPALLEGILENFEPALALMAEWSYSPDAPEALKELSHKAMLEIEPTVLYGDLLACDRFDIRHRLGEIETPTLVIGGTADLMTPLKFSRYLAEHIPRARLQVLEGAGHMMALEQPNAMAAGVAQFIADLPGL